MTQPVPLPPESLRALFDHAGLSLTDAEVARLAVSAAHNRALHDRLRHLISPSDEPATVFSARTAFER